MTFIDRAAALTALTARRNEWPPTSPRWDAWTGAIGVVEEMPTVEGDGGDDPAARYPGIRLSRESGQRSRMADGPDPLRQIPWWRDEHDRVHVGTREQGTAEAASGDGHGTLHAGPEPDAETWCADLPGNYAIAEQLARTAHGREPTGEELDRRVAEAAYVLDAIAAIRAREGRRPLIDEVAELYRDHWDYAEVNGQCRDAARLALRLTKRVDASTPRPAVPGDPGGTAAADPVGTVRDAGSVFAGNHPCASVNRYWIKRTPAEDRDTASPWVALNHEADVQVMPNDLMDDKPRVPLAHLAEVFGHPRPDQGTAEDDEYTEPAKRALTVAIADAAAYAREQWPKSPVHLTLLTAALMAEHMVDAGWPGERPEDDAEAVEAIREIRARQQSDVLDGVTRRLDEAQDEIEEARVALHHAGFTQTFSERLVDTVKRALASGDVGTADTGRGEGEAGEPRTDQEVAANLPVDTLIDVLVALADQDWLTGDEKRRLAAIATEIIPGSEAADLVHETIVVPCDEQGTPWPHNNDAVLTLGQLDDRHLSFLREQPRVRVLYRPTVPTSPLAVGDRVETAEQLDDLPDCAIGDAGGAAVKRDGRWTVTGMMLVAESARFAALHMLPARILDLPSTAQDPGGAR